MTEFKHRRTRISDREFFPMDLDFDQDPAVQALRRKYKAEGISVFIIVINILHREGGYIRSNELTLDSIAERSGVVIETVREILDLCIEVLSLLKISEDKRLYSDRVLRNLETRIQASEHAKKAARARWDKGQKQPKNKGNARASKSMPEHKKDAPSTKSMLVEESRVDSLKESTTTNLVTHLQEGNGRPLLGASVPSLQEFLKVYPVKTTDEALVHTCARYWNDYSQEEKIKAVNSILEYSDNFDPSNPWTYLKHKHFNQV